MRTKLLLERCGLAGSAAVLAALPFILMALNDSFAIFQLALVAIYLIALVGLDLLTGFSGQISLGNGAFMAIGAYTTAIVVHDHPGVSSLWTIPLAAVVTGAAGFGFGVPALRLSGGYLAIVTFALAVAVPQVIKRFDSLTGGSSGLVLPLPKAPFGWEVSSNVWLYGLCWAIAAAGLGLAWWLTRGRFGRALRATRDSEVAAASFGVDLARTKTAAFALSAAYAGVAGSLFAIANAYVSPSSFPILLSIELVIGVVVGGLGSLWGLVLGAVLIEFLPTWSQAVSKAPGVPSIVYGAVVIAIAILLPLGAAGAVRDLAGRLLDEKPLERPPE